MPALVHMTPKSNIAPQSFTRLGPKRRATRDEIPQHLRSLRAFAQILAQNRALADDLVEATIMKAFVAMDDDDRNAGTRVWLFTILHTAFYLDRQTAYVRSRKVYPCDRPIVGDGLAPRSTDDSGFKAVFDSLPVREREALVLIGVEGFSYLEAAQICRCTTSSLQSRIHRARSVLAPTVAHLQSGLQDETSSPVPRAVRRTEPRTSLPAEQSDRPDM